jgi:ankyrin repeat protein
MQGTYFEPSTGRLGLQLKVEGKDYTIQPIHAAAAAGDVAGLKAAWAADDKAPHYSNNRGQNAFHILARFGHFKALKAMFDLRGADDRAAARDAFDRGIRDLDRNKQRVLHHAAGNLAAMDLLLTRTFGKRGGAAINGVDYRLRTPLHRAALLGALAVVSLLLEAGADADKVDSDGRHPMHLAAERGHADVVAALMAHQATAEEAKLQEAQNEEAERKKKAGGMGARRRPDDDDDDDADADATHGPEDAGAAYGRWLNLKDSHQWTPLHLASRNGHNGVIGCLVAGGARADGTANGPASDGRRRLVGGGLAAPTMPALPHLLKSSPSAVLGSPPASPLPGGRTSFASKSRRGSFALPAVATLPATPRTPHSPGTPGGGGSWGGSSGPGTPLRRAATMGARGSFGGTASPGASPGLVDKKPFAPKTEPRFQPLEEAVGRGQPESTLRLLRSLGAGTSALAAQAVCHKPCGEQAQRDDGVCAQCLFRLQWQCGFRNADDDGSGTVVTLEGPPHLRSWRAV